MNQDHPPLFKPLQIAFALLLLFGCYVMTGCNTTTAEITSPNGQKQHIANSRLIWSTEEYDFGFDTNGVWHARATKSNPDAATVAAIAGLAKDILAAKP